MRKLLTAVGITSAILCVACAPVGPPPESAEALAEGVPIPEKLPETAAEVPLGLRERIQAAITQVERREVLLSNGFWTVAHGILGLGLELTLYDPETKRRVVAIDHICQGGEIRGMKFIPTEFGLDVQNGPMFVGQGHVDQFVAEMVQVGLPLDREFTVEGRQYTFHDFIRQAQARVRVTSDQELSWSIVAIGEFLGTDISWSNRFGENLHFEDLVRYELDQNVEEAACGGTHRLFGLAWVLNLHRKKGGEVNGVWRDVADKMARYQTRARELQNPDGSFSTASFRGPGNDRDMQQRISTTGHILEWLALSLPDDQLQEPWVQQAANALALMILEIQDAPMEGGTLYHGVHALRLYLSRLDG